jgi:hypothetical protein
MDLSVRIGSLHLRNPFIAASGCFGYGLEYAHAIDLSTLGGVAVKGLFLEEREGHAPPRIVETPAGMLNAIGLQGIGVHRFVAEKLPELRRQGATTIVNICGSTLDEYCEVARVLSDHEGVGADRAQYFLPEHQGRRHPVRVQPDRHSQRGQQRPQGDHAAADSQAHAERDRRCRRSHERRRRRARCGVAGEYRSRDGHRRGNAKPKLTNVGGWSQRSRRSGPIAVRMVWEVPAGGEAADSRAWAALRR